MTGDPATDRERRAGEARDRGGDGAGRDHGGDGAGRDDGVHDGEGGVHDGDYDGDREDRDHDGADGNGGGADVPTPDVVRIEHVRPTSDAVLRAVETVSGEDLLDDDERLADVLDADALDALFAGGDEELSAEIEFVFRGCRVTVGSDGHVSVTRADAA